MVDQLSSQPVMENETDENITDEVLRGSFLALKQLQTKGRKIAQIKKVSSHIQKPPSPRSELYERFKKLNGLDESPSVDLETKTPVSLLMYRTFREIFAEKNKKIRYSEEEKPLHPFFGQKTVLAEDFKLADLTGFSGTIDKITEEIDECVYKVNYDFLPKHELQPPKKERMAVVKPLKTKKLMVKEHETLDSELLRNIQQVLVTSDED